jgi:hypothetical protein
VQAVIARAGRFAGRPQHAEEHEEEDRRRRGTPPQKKQHESRGRDREPRQGILDAKADGEADAGDEGGRRRFERTDG